MKKIEMRLLDDNWKFQKKVYFCGAQRPCSLSCLIVFETLRPTAPTTHSTHGLNNKTDEILRKQIHAEEKNANQVKSHQEKWQKSRKQNQTQRRHFLCREVLFVKSYLWFESAFRKHSRRDPRLDHAWTAC